MLQEQSNADTLPATLQHMDAHHVSSEQYDDSTGDRRVQIREARRKRWLLRQTQSAELCIVATSEDAERAARSSRTSYDEDAPAAVQHQDELERSHTMSGSGGRSSISIVRTTYSERDHDLHDSSSGEPRVSEMGGPHSVIEMTTDDETV